MQMWLLSGSEIKHIIHDYLLNHFAVNIRQQILICVLMNVCGTLHVFGNIIKDHIHG